MRDVYKRQGLLRPDEGTVYCEGEDIFATKEATRDVRFKVGLVFQYPEYQLFEETVYKLSLIHILTAPRPPP